MCRICAEICDLAGNVTARRNPVNNTSQVYAYDQRNRLTERTINAMAYDSASPPALAAYQYSHEYYSYDGMSRLSLTDRQEDGRRDWFFYMDTGELNQAFYGTPSYGQGGPWTAPRYAQYYLDRAGNRYGVDDNGTPTTFTPNNLNQYAQTSNGSEHEITGYGTVTYRHLGDTRLAEVNAPGQNYKLGYDALGRCVRRETNGQVAYSAYDGEHSILEYNSTGAITVTTLYGLGIDEIIARGNNGDGQFLHQDRLGNTTAVLNIAGEVTEQYRYDAFGQPAIKDASCAPRTQTAINNRVLFTGREWVPQFGIYEYRNRAYHPGLGRFMSEDPMGFKAGDRNLFRYCGGDPVNRTDPTGLIDTSNPFWRNLTSTGGGDWQWFNGGVAAEQMQQQRQSQLAGSFTMGLISKNEAARGGDAKLPQYSDWHDAADSRREETMNLVQRDRKEYGGELAQKDHNSQNFVATSPHPGLGVTKVDDGIQKGHFQAFSPDPARVPRGYHMTGFYYGHVHHDPRSFHYDALRAQARGQDAALFLPPRTGERRGRTLYYEHGDPVPE